MSYNKVMVAYDGSEGSERALIHCLQHLDVESELKVVTVIKSTRPMEGVVAANSKVNPILINNGVYQYPAERHDTINQTEADAISQGHEQEIREEGEAILRKAKQLLDQYKVKADTETLKGDPAKVLCEHAVVNDFDLIVIGSRGLSGLKKLVLGSVSQKVVKDADCAVVVVK